MPSPEQKETIAELFAEGLSPSQIRDHFDDDMACNDSIEMSLSTIRSVRDKHMFNNDGKWELKTTAALLDHVGQCKEASIRNFVKFYLPFHHELQQRMICEMISGFMATNRYRASDLSRAMAGKHDATASSSIQRINNFTRNDKMSIDFISRRIFGHLTREASTVAVAVDWTDFSPNDQITLQFLLVVDNKQGIPIFWKTVPKSQLTTGVSKKMVYTQLLRQLRTAWVQNPLIERIIILGDREFGNTVFMEACRERDIDFCMRMHANAVVYQHGTAYRAGDIPRDMRPMRLKNVSFTKERYKVKTLAIAWERGMDAPWFILSSLSHVTARQLVNLYARRWNIETNFKADKDENFGMGFGKTLFFGKADEACERRDRFWIIVSLTSTYLLALGKATEILGLDRLFSSSSATSRKRAQFSTRRKGTEMYRWWKQRVLAQISGERLRPRKKKPLSPAEITRRHFDLRGYILQHVDELVEVFRLCIHILQHPSRYLGIHVPAAAVVKSAIPPRLK
jgi:hypothetical protein